MIDEQKAALRRRMRLARDLIDDRALRSVGIWSKLAQLPAYRQATVVLGFSGIKGEPDTDVLVERLAADRKTLALPAVDGDHIVPRLIGAGLVPGPLGVPTPQGDPVALADIDLVVVPGVAFTPGGRRLGRGGGHYDRLLAALPAGCPTVGVCFAEQLLDDLPVEAHDRSVGLVISDDLPE